MDIGRIFSRALEISWRHKVLWVFGFIMALSGGARSFSGNLNFGTPRQSQSAGTPNFDLSVLLPFVIVMGLCLLILFLVLALYFRFVARGALVAAVRGIESGSVPSLGAAWREGRAYYARLLGLGFLVNVPLVLFSLVLIAIGVLPFVGAILAVVSRSSRGPVTGPDLFPQAGALVGALALLCCAIVVVLIVSLVIHPIYEFAVRAIVLENTRTIEGWSLGWRRLRANLGSVAGLYLLLIGSRIAWSIGVGIASVPLVLVMVGVIAAAANASPVAGILFAVGLGLPLIVLLAFLEGLFEVFESNVWTEGYLALLGAPGAAALPEPAAS